MILGTVELGLNYGINNKLGKPTRTQAFELLDTTWNLGIRELDTAVAYGDAEEIIGTYQKETGHQFLVDTKLPPQKEYCVLASCRRLNTAHLNVLYLHSFEQCKNEVDFLQEQKQTGLVNYIGISIYEPHEMQYICDFLPCIDVIQFPFNVFDNYRWGAQILRAKEAGKLLYVRSIFLQGLIFKSPQDEFVQSIGATEFLEKLVELAKENKLSIAELAYSYVSQISEIDEIIIGCQTAQDVKMNVSMKKKVLSSTVINEITSMSKKVPNKVIDPRKWK